MAIRTLGSRYLLDEQIGQGGMGVVWRGRDKVTGTPFAIKLLRSEYAADPDAVTRFVRERTVLMKFRHPAVVSLHDMIVEGDQLALVMDLVGGGDLNAYRLRSGGTLPNAEAARIAAQICDGLAAAHAAGIIHRDLKPANVLLDAGHVKLADFGVARIVGDQSATTTGTVLGTAAYLAPELLTGSEPSAACDVYAFGITLYEVLAGKPPFNGHVAAIMHGHLKTAPDRLPDVPRQLWDLLDSCLDKDPAGRMTAAGLASALRDPGLLAVLASSGPTTAVPSVVPIRNAPGPPPRSFQPSPDQLPGEAPNPPVQVAAGAKAPAGAAAPVISIHTARHSVTAAMPPAPAPAPAPPVRRAPPMEQAIDTPAAAPQAYAPTPIPAPRRRSIPERRKKKASLTASPALLGGAAVVVLALVAAGVMAIASIGPFASRHQAKVIADPTIGVSTAANPGQTATAPATPRSARPGPSHSARTKKPETKKSQSASPRASVKPSSSSGGHAGGGSGGGSAPHGPNLAVDGAFADPTLSAWDYAKQNVVLVPGGGVNGQNAARLTATPQAGIAETITGISPGKYVVSGYIQASRSPLYIGERNDVSGKEVDVYAQPTGWLKLSVDFTVPSGQDTAVIFCVQKAGGSGLCSDITVYAVG